MTVVCSLFSGGTAFSSVAGKVSLVESQQQRCQGGQDTPLCLHSVPFDRLFVIVFGLYPFVPSFLLSL
jgi:hypothetical protein